MKKKPNKRSASKKDSVANRKPTQREAIKYLNTLDLRYISDRLVKKNKFSRKKANEAVRRYKQCLALIKKNPDINFVPTSDIDEGWHAHILHTKEYFKDCKMIFGRYMHHAPVTTKTTKTQKSSMNKSFILFAKAFEDAYGEPYIEAAQCDLGLCTHCKAINCSYCADCSADEECETLACEEAEPDFLVEDDEE